MLRALGVFSRVRDSRVPLALCVIGVVGMALAIAYVPQDRDGLLSYARMVINACRDAEHRPSCYEKEVPRLMDVLSMEEVFSVVALIQERDKELLHCHTLGHHISDREVKKDPAAWESVVARCPANQCNNGCLHGVLIATYGQEYLEPEQVVSSRDNFASICVGRPGWENPSAADRGICYHGLGHLFMYATRADISASLDLCEFVTEQTPSFLPSCSQAVFMSVFQPIDPEGEALVAGIIPSKQERDQFCIAYSGIHYESCMNESWILFEEITHPAGLAKFCSWAGEGTMAQRDCYGVGLNKMAAELLLKDSRPDMYARYCEGLPSTWSAWCFTEGASNLLEASRKNIPSAIDVCSRSSDPGGCEVIIFSYYPTTYLGEGTSQYSEYCQELKKTSHLSCQ